MPSHTLDEVGRRVLEQRGATFNPANLQAIKDALENNPELLDNIMGQLRQREVTGERDLSDSPLPIAQRDEFDQALETAVNGGVAQPATPAALDQPPTQPAPPVVPVTQGARNDTSPNAPLPPDVTQQALGGNPPGQALGGGSGEALGGISATKNVGPTDAIDSSFIDLILAALGGAGVAGARSALAPDQPVPTRPPVGPADEPSSGLKSQAKVKKIAAPKSRGVLRSAPVEQDINARIDAEDVTAKPRLPREVQPVIRDTQFGGRPAEAFEFEGSQYYIDDKGRVANRTTGVVNLVEPNELARIKQFLLDSGSKFAQFITKAAKIL